MTGDALSPSTLTDDLKAAIVGLAHARQALAAGDLDMADELWRGLDRCAYGLAAIDGDDRERMRPVLLALLEELERTVAVFGAEHRDLGDRLRSASRSLAAGAAYRQAGAG
ncbi:MAG: hypothetical protein AAF543_08000 [Pseudomonadota bacterium]